MPAKAKCCSARSVKLKAASFAKAKKAATAKANQPLGPDGRFSKKAPAKKAAPKKASGGKKAKPCRVCGK